LILSKEALKNDEDMKGFIINIRKAKNEDVIVTVLSNFRVENYYRFFGARHSILQVGNFIDFEVEESSGGFMPKMRRLSQFGFSWIFDTNRLFVWQRFIRLFDAHLKDTNKIDPFYFDLLLAVAKKWDKQNPKRLAVEAYLKLLDYEGRLYNNGFCYICEEILDDNVALMRAFIPAHPYCIYAKPHNKDTIFKLFDTKSSIFIEDDIVNDLYSLLLKGL
jgi:recombinational DNA repair protein (RecF pathway)